MDNADDAPGRDAHSELDALLLAPHTLRAVLEGLPDATVAAARDGRIAFANARAEELFGYARGELIGRPVEMLWPERLRERYTRNAQLYFAAEHPLSFTSQARGLRKDGSEFIGEMSWGIVVTEAGPLLLATGRDVSSQRSAVQRLRRQSEQQAAVAALGERALGGADLADLAAEAIERMRATLPVDCVEIHHAAPGAGEATMLASWGCAPGTDGAARVPIRTGEEIFGELVVASSREDAFGDDERSFLTAVANVLAIAMGRLQGEDRMRHEALHDPLTGLANRALCRDRLDQALARSRRAGASAGVLFVDLDNFKRVNDVYGHAVGDAVLTAVGRRLAGAVRPADTVARLGGDEFVVVCEEIDDGMALALGRRIESAIHEPLTAGGVEHRLSASIGVALGVAGRTDPESLLAEADAAAYRAKAAGRDRVEVFDKRLRRRAHERVRTAAALEHALARGELRLAYQRIVSLADGATAASEALLRWDRPGGGASAPLDFIPLAEESALIVEIGAWALREACAEAVRAHGRDANAPAVWVNLSGRQVAQPDLPAVIAGCLRDSGLPAARLRLELTETVLLNAAQAAVRNLAELERLGVGIVLDDFGTGHSSLRHLREHAVTGVKVDHSLVAELGREDALVAAIVSVAGALGIDAVAEGVEQPGQAEILRELGCPLAQGFLFGAPRSSMGD